MTSFHIRQAEITDLDSIINLLSYSKLITQDIDLNKQCFLILNSENEKYGCGAIEFQRPYGLIRSVAVDPNKTRSGYAKRIVKELEKVAVANYIHQLYLLTETAESFFAKLDFKAIDREQAPLQIKQTNQFSELCPATATVMMKSIIPLK